MPKRVGVTLISGPFQNKRPVWCKRLQVWTAVIEQNDVLITAARLTTSLLHINRCAFHKQQPDCFFFGFCIHDIIGLDLEKRGGPPSELQTRKPPDIRPWDAIELHIAAATSFEWCSRPTNRDLLWRPFMFPTKSKTKLKAIICVLPQGGHLTGNNYVVVALSRNLVFLYETFASIYTVYLYLELESLLIIII